MMRVHHNISIKLRSILILYLLIALSIVSLHSFNSLNINNSFLPSEANLLLNFNESNAYSHIESQLEFGFRVPGTSAHDLCADWIRQQMNPLSNSLETQDFVIQKEGQPSYDCQNILAKINEDSERIVIFGAHWDTRNVAEKDYYNITQPIPGANDGASGVAVLIELARVLSQIKDSLDSQIWFLFIDAEDQGFTNGIYGLEGWDYVEGAPIFVDNIERYYDKKNENIECFILLDMVGGTNLTFIKEVRSDDALSEAIFQEGRNLGYNDSFPINPKLMGINDDHVPFYNYGIPVVDLIIDFLYGDWTYHHTHADDLSNIDPLSLKITGQTLESFIINYYSNNANKTWSNSSDSFPTWAYLIIVIGICLVSFVLWFFIRRRN